jgi:hypothetical protein
MLTRHLNELMARLERVADIGCAEIRKNELPYWYGQERTTVNIWRDIDDKWNELMETLKEKSSLLVGESDGVWVLVWGEGLTTSDTSWLKDIRKLANKPTLAERLRAMADDDE